MLYFPNNDTMRTLGRVRVLFKWSGEIKFRHKATYGPSVHPHVDRHGNACWPKLHSDEYFNSDLSELFLTGQPDVAVQYLISGFLEQVTVGDTFYHPYRWKQATVAQTGMPTATFEECDADLEEGDIEEPVYGGSSS